MWKGLIVYVCTAFALVGWTWTGGGNGNARAASGQGMSVMDVMPASKGDLSSHPRLLLDTKIETPAQNNSAMELPEKQAGDTIQFQLFAPEAAGRQIQGYTVELALRGKTLGSYIDNVAGVGLNSIALLSGTSGSGNPTLSMLSLSAVSVPASGYLGEVNLSVSRALTSSDVLEVRSASTAGSGGLQNLDVSQAMLTFTAAACPGDFDGNGMVNLADFLAFAGAFGTQSGDTNYDSGMDMDGSGAIDLSDFLVFAGVFGTTCEVAPLPPPPAAEDRNVLVALYHATDGPNWRFNTNWLSDRPLDEWYGVTTDGNGRVTELRLYAIATSSGDTVGAGSGSGRRVGNGLTGGIPAQLGNLPKLERLHLEWNQLTGSIPLELGNLSNLGWLSLTGNQLTGDIPSELGNLPNLESLLLYRNQLTGGIPSELGNLSNLERLDLYGNQLTGGIPMELGNLSNLERLSLSENQLTGGIPSELGNLSNLERLDFSGNQLTGGIPMELGNLSNLGWLSLTGNQLTGSIPSELGNVSNLRYLNLSENQLTGNIPSELGNLSNLEALVLHGNQLTGSIPLELGNLSKLEQLILNLTGLCAPTDATFQTWLSGVAVKQGVVNCADGSGTQ